jgi:hypothetical protein
MARPEVGLGSLLNLSGITIAEDHHLSHSQSQSVVLAQVLDQRREDYRAGDPCLKRRTCAWRFKFYFAQGRPPERKRRCRHSFACWAASMGSMNRIIDCRNRQCAGASSDTVTGECDGDVGDVHEILTAIKRASSMRKIAQSCSLPNPRCHCDTACNLSLRDLFAPTSTKYFCADTVSSDSP